MDDKREAAKKYQEWVKNQRRLENALKKASDEECIRLAKDKIPEYEYLALPPTTPTVLEPIKPFKDTKYRDQTNRKKQPKLSDVLLTKEEQDAYWEEHKEQIRDIREAKKAEHKRIYSRAPGRKNITEEERLEKQRMYYQENKERFKQYHKDWKAKNKARAKELTDKYNEQNRQKKLEQINAHDSTQPSPFLTAITKDGCNVCLRKDVALYNFKNEETKYYTGCICIACLNSYDNLEKDPVRMFKLRQYALNRARANKQYEKE